MSHAAFRAAICATPEDDTLRLVYADWLDEQGEFALAEFIRTQIELSHLTPTDPRRPDLEDRENELLRTHETTWLGSVPGSITSWKFDRGFLKEIAGDPRTLIHPGVEAFLESHPVTRLDLQQSFSRDLSLVQQLTQVSWLSRIKELLIDVLHLGLRGLGQLLQSEQLGPLQQLELTRLNQSGVFSKLPSVLSSNERLTRLKRFRLSYWSGPSAGLVKLVNATGIEELQLDHVATEFDQLLGAHEFRPLRKLELTSFLPQLWESLSAAGNRPLVTQLGLSALNETGVTFLELLNSPALGKLTALDLSEARVTAPDIRGLAGTDFWERCEELRLVRGHCPPDVMRDLANDRPPHRLRVLKLGETTLLDEGVRYLCDGPWAESLQELDLMRNFLSDDACRTIRDRGHLINLRHLDIRTNGPRLTSATRAQITDRGLEALAAAPCLQRLRHLNLHSLPITARGIEAIINNPNWKLAELDVGGTEIGAAGIKVLARSPHLQRLTRLNLSFIRNLRDEDLMPLALSPYLSPLCELFGPDQRLTPHVKSAFQERLGTRFHG